MAREARYDWRHGITKAKIIRICRGGDNNGGSDNSDSGGDIDDGTKDRKDNNDVDNNNNNNNSNTADGNVNNKNSDSNVIIRDETYRRISLTIRKFLDTRKQVKWFNRQGRCNRWRLMRRL